MKLFRQLMCDHAYTIDKWHFTHGATGNELRYIEGFEVCTKCGKQKYFWVKRNSKLEKYIMNNMEDKRD